MSSTSPTNFSHLERKQQAALKQITGRTLSQHLNVRNLNLTNMSNKWKGQPAKTILNSQRGVDPGSNTITPTTGFKGAKLPKNSRMHGFLKNKARDRGFGRDARSPNS